MISKEEVRAQMIDSLVINTVFCSILAIIVTPWMLVPLALKLAACFDMERVIRGLSK